MGSLKPGATYIYERVGDTVYAREAGAPPESRQAVGWDYDPASNPHFNRIRQQALWDQIFEEAKSNPALQKALEQCIIIYNLSKDHGT
jgi:hypothetical protein